MIRSCSGDNAPERPSLGLAARNVHANLALLDPRGLSGEVAQVVQLCTPDAAPSNNGDRRDHRAVQREDALDTDTARDLPNGEGLADAASAARDAHTLECLKTLL